MNAVPHDDGTGDNPVDRSRGRKGVKVRPVYSQGVGFCGLVVIAAIPDSDKILPGGLDTAYKLHVHTRSTAFSSQVFLGHIVYIHGRTDVFRQITQNDTETPCLINGDSEPVVVPGLKDKAFDPVKLIKHPGIAVIVVRLKGVSHLHQRGGKGVILGRISRIVQIVHKKIIGIRRGDIIYKRKKLSRICGLPGEEPTS